MSKTLSLTSFSYKHGQPPNNALVVDCRKFANPYYRADLKSLTGRDRAVQDFITNDTAYEYLFPAAVTAALNGHDLAFGCLGGRHRSVAMAELVAAHLRSVGNLVQVTHTALDG